MHKSKNIFILLTCLCIIFSANVVRGDKSSKGEEGASTTTWIVTAVFGLLTIIALGSVCSKRNQQTSPARVAKESVREARLARFQPSNTQQNTKNNAEKKRDQNDSPEPQVKKSKIKPQLNIEIRDPGKSQNKITNGDSNDGTRSEKSVKSDTAEKTLKSEPPKRAELNVRNTEKQPYDTLSHDYDSEYDEAILAAINDLNLDNEAVVTSIDSQTPGLGVDSGDGSQFVFPSVESQPTSTPTEVSVSASKTTTSSLKRQVPNESPSDEDAKVPPLPKLFIDTLSHILDTQIKVQERDRNESRDRNVMFIKEANIPQNATDVSKKSLIIFTRRMAREYVGKMRYCIQCYEKMGCVQFSQTEIVSDIKTSLTDAVAMTILSELNEDLQGSGEDDLWSDVGGKSNVDESGPLTELLLRVSGWSDDDVTISTDLLRHILKMAMKDESKEKGILKLISVAAQHIKSTKRIDETMLYQRKFFQALENLASQATFIEILVRGLKCEIEKSETALGIYFEENGIFGELLSLTTIPVGLQEIKRPDPITSAPFLELRGFPRASLDDMKFLENNIQGVFHRTQKVVFDMVKKMLKCDRTAVLSWLAAVVSTNELRASANPLIHEEITNTACSDGFMLNLCTVLLELCMPFCQDITKLTKIDVSYAGSTSCRLNYNLETCLASGQIVQEEGDMKDEAECEKTAKESFNFMTEIFHITQRALNVGIISATNTFLHNNQSLARAFHAQWKGTPQEQELNNRIILWGMKWDCHLLDPEMLRKTSEFYLAQAQWLLIQLSSCEQTSTSAEDLRKQQANVFSHVPEYTVKDMARWFSFMANRGLRVHKGVLTGLQISPFIDCCVMLLERHDLMPGPVCATRIIETLYAFIQTGGNSNDMSRRGGWGSGLMSELGSMVHTCPTVRNSLGPALLHTFVSVDVVEGLDVDKEDFEKYRSRHEISKLIEHLWNRQDCRTSILALCGQPIFQKFLGAILDELLFMLHDGLGTLSSVRRLEQAKANESEWNKQTPQQQQDKEKFLKAEESRAAGAMTMANNLMAFLELLTKSEDVARCLTILPLAQRAANAILGFVEKLCGPNSLDFKVKDMNKYKFTPRILLKQIVEIILRVTREESSRSEGFLVSMATDPDFNHAMFEKAAQVIGREGLTEEATLREFQEVLQVVIKLKEEKQSESLQAGHQTEATHNWEDEITKMEINEETYADAYTESLENYTFDSADLQNCHSYTSNFGDKPVDPRAPKLKAFRKELKQLQDLPLNIHAAIFIRQDEDRIDMLRALVTGPSGTPYSGGCFCFDIYLPNNYPNIPPLVKFITTGNGTVRFNPNLYSDGKVCLSLLGTWHGGNASEKWNPQTSSIYQVLMSIQSLILISDPMYNEPGQEGLQGTTEGDMRSEAYNQNIRLYTIRHAMLGQLRHPTKGFENVIRRHFKVQRDLILKQCSDWLKRCDDSGIEKRMRRSIEELCTEINNIEIEEEETCDDSEDGSLED